MSFIYTVYYRSDYMRCVLYLIVSSWMAISSLHQATTLIVIICHVPVHTDVNSVWYYSKKIKSKTLVS